MIANPYNILRQIANLTQLRTSAATGPIELAQLRLTVIVPIQLAQIRLCFWLARLTCSYCNFASNLLETNTTLP